MQDERTHERRMRLRILGNIDLIPAWLKETARQAETITRNYDNIYLNIAMAYGGRQEIVDTARVLAQKVESGQLDVSDIDESGQLDVSDIDEEIISSHLYPSTSLAVPDVDLIIRTGGDERMSNFLPWQANGNECAAYF
jgi:tritrans,polycis-undecaprenyl-diphosphate synthase [geranylgeranyl-diphosphate specific]